MAYPERVAKAIQRARAAMGRGEPQQALQDLERAAAKYPKAVEAWGLMSQCLGMLQDHAAAEKAVRRALALDARYADGWFLLGIALGSQQRYALALDAYERYVALCPGRVAPPNVLQNVAACLVELDRFDDATTMLRDLVKLKNVPEVWYLLAVACQGAGLQREALAAYGEVKDRGLYNFTMALNMGVCHHALQDYDAGADCAHDALALRPGDAAATLNRVLALAAGGRVAEAVAEDVSASRVAQRSRLLWINYLPATDPVAARREHESFAQAYPRTLPPLEPLGAAPGEKIRLGFVSGDFREHPVLFFFRGLLQALDRSRFDITLYSTSTTRDRHTELLQAMEGHRWVDLAGRSDEEAAAALRADRLHVAVDLSGPTSAGVPGVFALRAAPVQLSWIGYGTTTGLPEMDSFLTDSVLDPAGHEPHYTEQLARLDPAFVTYSPPTEAPGVAGLPLLAKGHATLGSFTQLGKLSHESIRLWSDALASAPGARLFLMAKGLRAESTRQRLLSQFAAHGIAAERIELRGAGTLQEFLAAHAEVDLLLETVPWNAHTTAMHGLWMGVPTVTLPGDRRVARFGEMIHRALGTADTFVAPSAAEYGATVANLLAAPDRLARFRQESRSRMQASPLCDHAHLARAFEAQCVRMVQGQG